MKPQLFAGGLSQVNSTSKPLPTRVLTNFRSSQLLLAESKDLTLDKLLLNRLLSLSLLVQSCVGYNQQMETLGSGYIKQQGNL